jgi:hypothetical protein
MSIRFYLAFFPLLDTFWSFHSFVIYLVTSTGKLASQSCDRA